MEMPREVVIRTSVTARFETFSALTPSTTLLLNAHGMQAEAFVESDTGGAPALPDRNYAFTVPWDRALFNPFFKPLDKEGNLYRYMTSFKRNADRFSGRPPRLAIYPFLFDRSWRPVFEAFVLRDLCDSAQFYDLEGADYIMFDDLLRAPHWRGGTFATQYTSFLLLTCRSDLKRGIGKGGADQATPNGLYRATDRANPLIPIV
jgi:hypothetical protein